MKGLPLMKTVKRTDKKDYGTTIYIRKSKDDIIIDETIEYTTEGELREFRINYSDKTGEYKTKSGEMWPHRDEIHFDYQAPNHWGTGSEVRESVRWSTGWEDTLEGKEKELAVRTKALKYFAKRRIALLGEK
jgi:hypothetical protein